MSERGVVPAIPRFVTSHKAAQTAWRGWLARRHVERLREEASGKMQKPTEEFMTS